MPTVDLRLPDRAYPILIEPAALERVGEVASRVAPHARAAVVVDAAVARLHLSPLLDSLKRAGFDPVTHTIEGGEPAKTLPTLAQVYDTLATHRLERRSPVVTLGGGVVGDMGGFAAATWLRGAPFLQVPTTLLAMVDASVGGKTGVNLPQGKNLVGAFHQPVAVVVDPNVLTTLPRRELRSGLAECVKHAMIRDADHLGWLEANVESLLGLEPATLVTLVEANVRIKASVVEADEKEAGVRAHLNFGHTFAHAIETTTGYGVWAHGEAVAVGMVAACSLAVMRGMIEPEVVVRLQTLLSRIGLPVSSRELPEDDVLLEAMRLDKKVAGDRIRLVLPERIGAVTVVDDAEPAEIRAAWASVRG